MICQHCVREELFGLFSYSFDLLWSLWPIRSIRRTEAVFLSLFSLFFWTNFFFLFFLHSLSKSKLLYTKKDHTAGIVPWDKNRICTSKYQPSYIFYYYGRAPHDGYNPMLDAKIFPFRKDLMFTAVKAIFQMTHGTNQFVSVHQVSRDLYY